MTPKTATLEIPELMQFLRQQLHDLPDERKPGNNRQYQIEDAVMAAFSIFFTQSESFLDHQRLMKSNKGKDNTVLDLVNYTYQKVRELLVTRTTFFKDMRTLLKFIWFKDWSDFFSFISREYVPFKKTNSS